MLAAVKVSQNAGDGVGGTRRFDNRAIGNACKKAVKEKSRIA